MLGICDNLDITITNVFQSTAYSVKYCLITAPYEYAMIEVWYNSKGQFTKAQCWSSLGDEDGKLVALMQRGFKEMKY